MSNSGKGKGRIRKQGMAEALLDQVEALQVGFDKDERMPGGYWYLYGWEVW